MIVSALVFTLAAFAMLLVREGNPAAWIIGMLCAVAAVDCWWFVVTYWWERWRET